MAWNLSSGLFSKETTLGEGNQGGAYRIHGLDMFGNGDTCDESMRPPPLSQETDNRFLCYIGKEKLLGVTMKAELSDGTVGRKHRSGYIFGVRFLFTDTLRYHYEHPLNLKGGTFRLS